MMWPTYLHHRLHGEKANMANTSKQLMPSHQAPQDIEILLSTRLL